MKAFTILALAATALAVPSTPYETNPKPECTPPSYACKPDNSGWLVCNVDGKWLDGGACPAKTTCKPINNLPYCV
ncbi:hypothetical protein JX265_009149 [Neoarthrinium moseri]|uniref:Uncharacterized protein n=1 Tax=Neoarthrinium moseri TaxID=1658444 RepID=A0A9P9WGM1_9PEZI|nr:uncharacterized protein JN550_011757 [Neoarthrinium moseri]KAI1847720.1 hypothetical protein JX266_006215 [Neoarthrinium moseri]KAI1859946.1 hypothetical protein JN550_011757 [Neoarthrinium moseri]KAI1862435.1 hypothetical protein JX265_009149 [Neoarthrinium moseri]